MKLIYKTIAHYPKSYKVIKVALLVITLFLSQIFVSLFHSELILEKQLQEEGAPFTQIYAFRNQEIDYPGGLRWFLMNHIDYETYGISDIYTSQAIILSDDLFIENNEHIEIPVTKGKNIQDLTGDEVAVSAAYAIRHFGTVENALNQTITEGVSKSMENREIIYEMTIASIYEHSGLNRRYLNALSSYEYDPTGGNSVYAETIYVANSAYREYMTVVGSVQYVSDVEDEVNVRYQGPVRTRFVTKFTIQYDDYSLENEQALGNILQIKSANYDAYYVIFQSLGNIINASALMASSIGFMSSFQFVSLIVLLLSIIFYLIYLQQVSIDKNETVMKKIGIKESTINSQKYLHELLIAVIGFIVWLLMNLCLQSIFKEQILYVSEMFVFHQVIILINLVVAGVIGIFFALGARTIHLYPNVNKLFEKNKQRRTTFNRRFYLKRLFSITPARFLMMVLVGALSTGSFFVLSRFEPEINDIYVQEQPIQSDFSITLNYEQDSVEPLELLNPYFDEWLMYQEKHNNIIFTERVQQGETNSTKVTQADLISNELWNFMRFPRNPEMTTEQRELMESTSHIILSRQLQKSLGISDESVYDFNELYGEVVYDPETGVGRFEDDLDLYVVPPRYFQKWGALDGEARVRVLGFDNIIDRNGNMFYNVQHSIEDDITAVTKNDRTPTTYHFMLRKGASVGSLKSTLDKLIESHHLESYTIGQNQNIFDYTGANTMITTILLVITFSLYLILTVLLIVIKNLNDRFIQSKNIEIYARLGLNEKTIPSNMIFLNTLSLVSGFLLGVVLVILSWPLIRYLLIDVLVLYH